MAKISIKKVSNGFMSIKRKEAELKKLQKQMADVKETQKKQTNIIVKDSTKYILEKTKLGNYLKDMVAKSLESGDSSEYDERLSLIVEGISKVVEDISSKDNTVESSDDIVENSAESADILVNENDKDEFSKEEVTETVQKEEIKQSHGLWR